MFDWHTYKADYFISLNEYDELVQSKSCISFSMLRHKHSHKNEILVDISSKMISYFVNVHVVLVLQKVHAHQFEPPPLCWPSCTICPRKTHLARNRICFLFSTLMTLQMFLGTLPKVTPLNSKYLPWRWSWAGALTRQANLS